MRLSCAGERILARFDQVWERLDELNPVYSDEETAVDIETARQG